VSRSSGPVYEVTLDVDPAVIDEFDAWLAVHVADMLQLPGFIEARVFTEDGAAGERVRRICQYRLDSDKALDEYLAGTAAEMRQQGAARFGDRYSARRRVLRPQSERAGPLSGCLNCGAALSGQYCGRCGQRARGRLITLGELLRDAFGDLLELDSRLWRTLIPLAVRPGRLTADYLRGRRARYMPPFRTYLVLSLLFFVCAFFDPQHQFGILLEADPGTTAAAAPDAALPGTPPGSKCELTADELSLPPWLARRLTPQRLEQACEHIARDNDALLERLLDNVPIGLYVLLPLIALVLKLLYPLARRYYVEHLLFVVHFHAFLFLALTLQLPVARLGDLLPAAGNVIVSLLIPLYIPVYLYKALRRVYGQGHLLTVPKYVLLVAAYTVISSVIFALAVLAAALSM